ncbi:hypothetical protein QQF64_010534 [Cirrhinus molitorella]|uniref:Uncharacterized protein n=1 Tax=Cirrhinus molitorella TaxID=172907 RepID=A0ABR3M4C3_9TELE
MDPSHRAHAKKYSVQVLFGAKEHRGLDENALSKICMKKEQSVQLGMSKNIPGETLRRSKYICLKDGLICQDLLIDHEEKLWMEALAFDREMLQCPFVSII